jgi:hypothetical protein
MALIRGLGCLCPCPKCYIPWDVLSDLTDIHPARTATETARVLERASTLAADDKEELLKQHGLRDTPVSSFGAEKPISKCLQLPWC